MSDKIEVRDARLPDVQIVYGIFADAFRPYRDNYTEKAYDITVCSPDEIRRRIEDSEIDVLVATCQGQIIGTRVWGLD